MRAACAAASRPRGSEGRRGCAGRRCAGEMPSSQRDFLGGQMLIDQQQAGDCALLNRATALRDRRIDAVASHPRPHRDRRHATFLSGPSQIDRSSTRIFPWLNTQYETTSPNATVVQKAITAALATHDSQLRHARPRPGCAKAWWTGLDSNQRTLTRADLQSAAFNHSATSPGVHAQTIRGMVEHGQQARHMAAPAYRVNLARRRALRARAPEIDMPPAC